MRAAVIEAPGHVTITTVEDPSPGPREVVIDCSGAVPAIEDGLRRVRRGGTFQIFGVATQEATANFSPFQLYNDEITVVGSMAVLHSFGRAVELMAAKTIDADTMISHNFPLTDYDAALAAFRAGTGRKLQIRPGMVS